MEAQSPLVVWFTKHKDKLLYGTILWLFATNQAQDKLLKKANADADFWMFRHLAYTEGQRRYADSVQAKAQSKIDSALVRKMLYSDSTYILAPDPLVHDTGMVRKDKATGKATD